MDADVYFPTKILKRLVDSKKKTAFLIDPRSKSTGEEMMLMAKNGRPLEISKKVNPGLKVLGEATGFFKVGKNDAKTLKQCLTVLVRQGQTRVEYEESYSLLMKKKKAGFVSVGNASWSEMDFEEDLKKIQTLKE